MSPEHSRVTGSCPPALVRHPTAAAPELKNKWETMVQLLLDCTWLPGLSPIRSESFHLNGSQIRDIRGQIVATYVRHGWEVNGVCYTHITCPAPVSLQFQSADADFEFYGPCGAIDLRGPAVWVNGKIAAILTDEVWRRPGMRTDWTTIVLCEALPAIVGSANPA